MHIQRPPLPAAQVLLLYKTFLFAWFKTHTGYVLFLRQHLHIGPLTKKHDILPLTTFALTSTFPMYLSLNIW